MEVTVVGASGLIGSELINQLVKNENISSKFRVYKNGIYRLIDMSSLAEATINKALEFFVFIYLLIF